MSNKAITVKPTNMDVMKLGDVLTQSGFFQETRQAAQAVVKVIAGQELGLGPVASMTGINIIKGRVTVSANAMAAIIKKSGRYDYRVEEHSNTACRIQFFEDGHEIGVSEFTIEDAETAGLRGDNWRKYPKNMLFARALSNGAKWYCPDCFSGSPIYTPDELGADVDGETGEVIAGEVVEYDDTDTAESDYEAERQEIIEQTQREIEDRQEKAAANKSTQHQALEAFYAEALVEHGLTEEETRAVLKENGVGNGFRPDYASDWLKIISDQLETPTTPTAFVVAVNAEALTPYENIHHIKQALKKAYPDVPFPKKGSEAEVWHTARKLAVEYHSVPEGNDG